MLNFDQIKELIELVGSHRMGGVELERSGFRLRIDGHQSTTVSTSTVSVPAAVEAAVAAPAVVAAPAAAASVPEAAEETSADEDLHVLTSPIVGTFYRRPDPESDPFISVGDRVRKGQPLCIVEAMKLMNEIESDVDGVVVEIKVENAQPVEFGEPLFAIRAD